MNPFRSWMERLFGLRSDVEDQIEQTVRFNTALVGAVARAQAVQEAESFAEELARTNPALAAALRVAIAEQVAAPLPTASSLPGSNGKSALPSESRDGQPPKRPGRPRKTLELPPTSTPPTGA